MEYTQWDLVKQGKTKYLSLNPCCNGIYSMSCIFEMKTLEVLILVVMEYTQWGLSHYQRVQQGSLNPCCNGIYSMRYK